VLLVAPNVGSISSFDREFYDDNDISVRYQVSGATATLIPNTLGDLTKRENRFAHYGNSSVAYGAFPFPVDLSAIPQNPPTVPPTSMSNPSSWPTTATPAHPDESAFLFPAEHLHTGDDVLLTNVLAFDVQVWDPRAPIMAPAGIAFEPSDPGWKGSDTPVSFGAYVDLGYDHVQSYPTGSNWTPFQAVNRGDGTNTGRQQFPNSQNDTRVYDTWSLHYEQDGVNQDVGKTSDRGTDTMTNGLDDDPTGTNGYGIVDDAGESDTVAPYTTPLRGMRIRIRVYEPDSQQVREAVVIQDFLPD
jgi:hypothetical protein